MEIESEIRQFVLSNYVSPASRAGFTDSTPLITGGLIDSIGAMALIHFLEGRYGFEFLPREVDLRSLETVSSIAACVRKKLPDARGGG